jgi:hypothetical protein
MEFYATGGSSDDDWQFYFIYLSPKEAVKTKLLGKLPVGTLMRVIRIRDWEAWSGEADHKYLVEEDEWEYNPDDPNADWTRIFEWVGVPLSEKTDYPPEGLFELIIQYEGTDDPGAFMDSDEEVGEYLRAEGVPEDLLRREGWL